MADSRSRRADRSALASSACRQRVLRLLLPAPLLVLACLYAVSPLMPAQNVRRPVTVVAAAADLQFAFTEIGAIFERRTGQKVVFSFGSTGNLARQIESGAPFDLFAAANETFVERLEKQQRLVPWTRQLHAIGRIVLASNRKSGIALASLTDLLDSRIKRIAIANPDHAPYGLAAKEALVKTGLWNKLEPKLVLGENIRQALQFVQTGNAEAGIIALSVADVPEVSFTLIDERLHSPLRQALALIKGTPHEHTARRFVAFVNGPEGRKIMAKYGFQTPAGR
jgi:molybdate transport system substrate-binding protein